VFGQTRGSEHGDTSMQKISPFLWFDDQAEEAMNFYVSIFKNSKVGEVTR
jgi:predicted 3-demethylubiquinone-9 3-methyltransferase (glyoxalase superfamily)